MSLTFTLKIILINVKLIFIILKCVRESFIRLTNDHNILFELGSGCHSKLLHNIDLSKSMAQGQHLPVFVTPTSLQFPLDDVGQHKQTLTLYNPYEFNVQFRVLGTSPNKYKLPVIRGTINRHHYVDLIVRHLSVNPHEIGLTDYLRVEVFRETPRELIGAKEVQLAVVRGNSNASSPSFTSFAAPTGALSASASVVGQRHRGPGEALPDDNRLLNSFIFMLVLACAVVVFTPTYYDPVIVQKLAASTATASSSAIPNDGFLGQFIPQSYRPTITQQLVASFTMGACVVVFFYKNLR